MSDFDVQDYDPKQGDVFERDGKKVVVDGIEKISERHGIRCMYVDGDRCRVLWLRYWHFVVLARRALKNGATFKPAGGELV